MTFHLHMRFEPSISSRDPKATLFSQLTHDVEKLRRQKLAEGQLKSFVTSWFQYCNLIVPSELKSIIINLTGDKSKLSQDFKIESQQDVTVSQQMFIK